MTYNLHLLSTCFFGVQDGIYTLPCHLSIQARDLITRILKADPLHRITIPEIRCHPWFQVQLPQYLAVPPPEYAQQLKRVIFFSSTDMLSLMRIGGWCFHLKFSALFTNIWPQLFFFRACLELPKLCRTIQYQVLLLIRVRPNLGSSDVSAHWMLWL